MAVAGVLKSGVVRSRGFASFDQHSRLAKQPPISLGVQPIKKMETKDDAKAILIFETPNDVAKALSVTIANDYNTEVYNPNVDAISAGEFDKVRPYHLGCATGSSPKLTYRLLSMMRHQGQILGTERFLETSWLDEYGLLPTWHPESYWTYASEVRALIPMADMHIPHSGWRPAGGLESGFHFPIVTPAGATTGLSGIRPEALERPGKPLSAPKDSPAFQVVQLRDSAAAYQRELDRMPAPDFHILGIGRTGHTGFNEPDASLTAETGVRAVALHGTTREDAIDDFAGDIANVPTTAITKGPADINKASKIALIATGPNKAAIMRQLLLENGSPAELTARFQLGHEGLTIYMDKAAAGELRLGL